MRAFDPRLSRYASATRGFMVALIAVGSVSAALLIVQAFALVDIVVPVFLGGADLSAVATPLMVLGAVIVCRILIAYLTETLAFRSSSRAKIQLRTGVLRHIFRLGPVWLSGRNSSQLTLVTTRGIDALDAYFSRYLPQLVLAVIVPISVGMVIAIQDPLAAVIVVLTVPLIPIFMILVGMYTQRKVRRQWRTLAILSGHFADVVAGMPTLKIFGRAQLQAARIREIGTDYRTATMGVLRVSFLSALVLEVLAMLSIAMVAVSIGLRLVHGSMTLEAGLLVLILVPEVYWPIRQVGIHFHAAAEGLGAAGELVEIIETPAPTDGTESAPNLANATIEFRDVSVTYAGREQPALDSVSCTILPRKINAVVGPSGCGKSTLLMILERFLDPDAGEVRVCTDGRVAQLHDYTVDSWRSQVAWVGQDPKLIAGTLADNVRLYTPEACDQQVQTALVAVGLRDLITELPNGLATPIGEAGRTLSAGQQHRVALARVLVSSATLVLLDEPTAALDQATEADVLAAIGQLAADRTIVMVAHRQAAVDLADVTIEISATSPPRSDIDDLSALAGVPS